MKEEVACDLVGDYIFSNVDFVRHLSTTSPKGFQKIWDEVKYLCKVATAGSKEARELARVKRVFEEAYRGEKNTATGGGAKYSLMEYTQHQKDNWATSKRIVVYDNANQLSKFIQDSISDNTMNKKMYFGAISPDLAARIMEDTGLNVENYNLSLGAYEIRKILKDHGDDAIKSPKGQRSVVPDDLTILLILSLIRKVSRNPKSCIWVNRQSCLHENTMDE